MSLGNNNKIYYYNKTKQNKNPPFLRIYAKKLIKIKQCCKNEKNIREIYVFGLLKNVKKGILTTVLLKFNSFLTRF